ncbi:MAG TPA: AMP-binding protein [Saprospiraceae bacterium]|nr:AMP-binding protein [Saprospiraceae bacterium]
MEEKRWLKNYPNGVPANINADKYECLLEMFDEVFEQYKNKPAFSCMGKTLSFKDVDTHSRHFAAYLQSRGLEKGDRIALMMPNLLQYPIALFGALRAGLVVVNTNPLYTPREMKHQFKDSGVKAILIAENFASNLEKIIGETDIKMVITTSIGEMLSTIKGAVVNFVVRRIKGMVPKYNIPNTVKFSDALKQGQKFKWIPVESKKDDVILLQYTGGTTGISKGAMLTNRNLVANMEQISTEFVPFMPKNECNILCPLPLYHIFAFSVNCLAMLKNGCHNILITNARDLNTVIKAFKNYDIHIMSGVNTLFNALLNNDDFRKLDFSPLTISVAGGMALQVHVAEDWEKLTDSFLIEGYGLTETAPVASVNPCDGSGRLGTVGMPVPSTDMKIVDENGVEKPIGEEGEIVIKGPQVMKGYYNKEEETKKVFFADGWFRSGDIGIMEEDGFFKIVDRKKDMINVSGFNVYPNEIEEVVTEHEKVLEAAAVGVPDQKSGEVVKLFVVKKDKSLTEKELIEFCRARLTGYKVPKKIEFKKELPKTNVGKILRRELRE